MRSFFSALCNVCHQRVVPEAPPQFPPKLHSLKGHRRATLFLIWASVSNSTMIPIWTKENSGLLRSQSSVTTALHSPIHKKVIRVTFECAMFLLFRSLRYSNLHCRKGAELCFSVFFFHMLVAVHLIRKDLTKGKREGWDIVVQMKSTGLLFFIPSKQCTGHCPESLCVVFSRHFRSELYKERFS